MFKTPIKIASLLLIGIGGLLLILTVLFQSLANIALPLVFLMLGGAFFLVALFGFPTQHVSSLFHIPGSLCFTFGLIFLLNILTQDWQSWAYAWLLLLTSLGIGILLAERNQPWPAWLTLCALGFALGGITLFCIFGAIVGGLFIQISAPLLLVLGGISLRWLHPETLLPETLRQRLNMAATSLPETPQALLEPLSDREIEVLQGIERGLSNQQIAAQLHIAGSTVKTHINNIYSKLGVQTRTQAIHRARELKLL